MPEQDLRDATSLAIGYTVRDERREFKVTEPDKVREILDTIQITGSSPGKQLGIDPFGYVDFEYDDGSVVRTSFVHANQLDRAFWGQVYLDESFHRAVCKAASENAGIPVEVVTDNG